MIKIQKFGLVALMMAIPVLAFAQTVIDPLLPLLGDKTAQRVVAAWPLVFYAAQAIKKLWTGGRKTIVGRVVFPVLDFVTGDTVPKVGP